MLRRWMWRRVKDITLIVAGIFTAAFGLEGFLLPNSFIDGGATGIALLVAEHHESTGWAWPCMLVNIPFVILGYTFLGRRFALKIAFAIVGLAIVIITVHFPVVTHEKLLVGVFGGFFLGAGIGLSIRGGAVLDRHGGTGHIHEPPVPNHHRRLYHCHQRVYFLGGGGTCCRLRWRCIP